LVQTKTIAGGGDLKESICLLQVYQTLKIERRKKMKERTKGKLLLVVLMTLMISGASLVPAAPKYPDHPIEIILPNEPGGGMDFINTLFKNSVEKIIKQPIILVYKGGAGGLLGTVYAKGCKPDGYTLMASSSSTLILPALTRKEGNYTLDDFTPIGNLTEIPHCYCVREDSPYKTMREFIQAAKTKQINYGTYGTFSLAHLAMEALGKAAGYNPTHIPYKGAAASMTACIGGHIDMAVAATTAFLGPGKLRLLAVDGRKRLEGHPDVPTLMELGYPLITGVYYGLWGPKGIPKDVVNVIYEAYKKAAVVDKDQIYKMAGGQDHKIVLVDGGELKKMHQDQWGVVEKIVKECGDLLKQ
jgi:tripartite-type tricarboxylate transporter receptor subunit TctC